MMNRRRLLQTLFCSSMAMKLNLASAAEASPTPGNLDLLALGDFGSGDKNQRAVAEAMTLYARALGKPTDGILMLGDNFYGKMPGGVTSPRWQTGFSDLYPKKDFPGKCWAVLGNHDYSDTPGNELVQLGYAASRERGTRWTMPGKYYRVDLPTLNPLVTFLMIDTNNRDLTPAEQANQRKWLEAQLASRRALFTVVVGHHPLYSNGNHGDTKRLISDLGPLFEKSGVHLYLCGHDHDMQHLELKDLRTSFVISGGGGAGLRPLESDRKDPYGNAVHGFTHLSVRNRRLHIRHLNRSGKVLHGFSKGPEYDWRVTTT